MSYQYHGTRDLIAMPGRSVQTYPSGLVRVERSFMCRKGDVARYRSTLRVNEPMPFDDGAPAIDGLFIFPEPQEQVRDDGFVEFRVTAYGRTSVFSIDRFQKQAVKEGYASAILTRPTPGGGIRIQELNIDSLKEIYIFSFVMGSTEPTTAILEKPKIDPIVLPRPNYNVPLVAGTGPIFILGGQGFGLRRVELFLVLDVFNSTNFGRWSEYSVGWKSDATESRDFTRSEE
jgi:hypothetical protein